MDDDIFDTLSLQLAEVEMIQSMFANPGEMEFDDPLAVDVIRTFTEERNSSRSLTERIGFTLKLNVGNRKHKKLLEVVCRYPHEYPSVPLEIYLTSPLLPRSNHRQLSDDLLVYVQTLERGELCLCFVIEWLKENAPKFMEVERTAPVPTKPTKTDLFFSRMWIYSHHIYSKIKRTDMQRFAKELNLTGFYMSGKPGMIVIEGYLSGVEEFWSRVRKMTWKRIVMKEREDTKLDDKDVDDFRKFVGFEEKFFEARQGKGRGAHADLGLLLKFLQEHSSTHIFSLFFGVEGKGVEQEGD